MLAVGEGIGVVLLIASLLLTAASLLIKKKPKVASLDDALQSTATQGAYLPLVIGRQRVGPVFGFVEDTTSQVAALANGRSSGAFSKGNGSTPSQPAYWERALHLICVGPASELRAIYQNGELIWKGPITPQDTPSGSLITVTTPSGNEGAFRVFWGLSDDPIIPHIGSAPTHGIATRYALSFKILWDSKNLGQSRQWPRLEYEVVCPCYSQVALTPTEVPREGDKARPLFGAALADMVVDVGSPSNPGGLFETDRQEAGVISYDPFGQAVNVVDISSAGGGFYQNKPGFFDLIRTGDIVRLWTSDNTYPGFLGNNISALLPVNGQWRYFYVSRAVKVAATTGSTSFIRVELGSEVDPAFLFSSAPNLYQTPKLRSWDTANPPPSPIYSPAAGGIARIQPVASRNADGVNPIHMIDQLLFAKYPYGPGKDRSKFDEKSIEEAAFVLQGEKIRGGVAILDGEGLESILAPILTDIATQIVWDVEIGKHCFRPVRLASATVDLPENAVLERPTMAAPVGNRVADVLAFTFNDRERNYREVPLRLMDSGQVAEYESQRAKKISIEVTQDRDSVSRLMPLLQQGAFANQSLVTFKTNHATRLAASGSRFKASTIEGPEFQFMVTSVQRDPHSTKTDIEALLDVYQPPTLPENYETSNLQVEMPEVSNAVYTAPQVTHFAAFELPKALHSGGADVEMLFLASRADGSINSCVVWASRDGTTFSAIGFGVVAARGSFKRALTANGPAVEEVNIPIAAPLTELFGPTVSLGGDPDSWRAGIQILIAGGEVMFVRDVVIESEDEEEGEKQGYVSGLIRGRAGTRMKNHAVDSEFWVVHVESITPTSSPNLPLGPGRQAKPQAVTLRGASNIAEVDAIEFNVTGKGFTPEAPHALRLSTYLPGYVPGGGNVTVLWAYSGGLLPKTGLGFQPLGTKIATSPPEGDFLVEVLDKDDVVLHSRSVTSNSVTFTFLDRTNYGVEYEELWKVRVTHRIGAFASSSSVLEIVQW
jgi:hypothetical protein